MGHHRDDGRRAEELQPRGRPWVFRAERIGREAEVIDLALWPRVFTSSRPR